MSLLTAFAKWLDKDAYPAVWKRWPGRPFTHVVRDWSKKHHYLTLLLVGLFLTSLTFGRKRGDVAARMGLFAAGFLAGHFWF